MVVIPTNNFKLIQLPIELDDNNQLLFDNRTQQYNYFNSLPTPKYNSDFTYIRESGVVRYEANIEDIQHYNYCMYQNESYGNKWFYAFIDDMEYRNNETTFIKIRTDYFQTWIYDCNIKKTFVEREHVSDDTFGKHTLPENLDTGQFLVSEDFTCVLPNDIVNNPASFGVGISSNLKLYSRYQMTPYFEALLGKVHYHYDFISSQRYNGIIRNYQIWGVPYANYDKLELIIQRVLEYNQLNYIKNLFIFPLWLIDNPDIWYVNALTDYTINDDTSNGLFIPQSQYIKRLTQDISPSNYLGNSLYGTYTPKNNKCLTSQFNHIVISNNKGENIMLRMERWKKYDNNYRSFIVGIINDSGCEIKLIPHSYNYIYNSESINIQQKSQVSLSLSPYPSFSIGVSNYNDLLNRFTQKSNISGILGGATAIGGILTGNPLVAGAGIGTMINGALTPSSSQTELYNQSFQNTGIDTQDLLSFYERGNTFMIQRYSVDYEHAKMIDDYFSMFGYRVNELKVPNLRSRVNFNYVKTIGCNLTGNIPRKAQDYIKSLFDSGITLWHNPSTYLDYGSNNIR